MMFEIFLQTLPLSLAASVSVTSFLLFFAILLSPVNPVRNGLAFIVGGLLANAALTLVVLLLLGNATPASSPHRNLVHASVNFTLAATCLVFVLMSLKRNDTPRKKKKNRTSGGVLAVVVSGVFIRLLSANTVPPYIDAVKDVTRAHLPMMSSAILWTSIMVISMLPLIVIWFIFLCHQEKALTIVRPLGVFLENHRKVINNGTLILIACYMVFLGFEHLGMI